MIRPPSPVPQSLRSALRGTDFGARRRASEESSLCSDLTVQSGWITKSIDLNLSPSGFHRRQIIWRLFGFAPQCTKPRQSAPKIQRNSETVPNNEISRWVTAA